MYIQLTYQVTSEEQKEILIARLSAVCEGFEESGNSLKAFFKNENYTGEIRSLVSSLEPQPVVEKVREQNWNSLWESNFDPVVVDDFVAVRADFHQPIKSVKHEIIITPKMSFGTGHHATTFLMLQQMAAIDFNKKSVFDFGTGTGVLAILAKKLGAAKIIATDIDEWSIKNASENFLRNDITDIELKQSGSAQQGMGLDVIVANINRNILMETIPQLAATLKTGGVLLLSGLLQTDRAGVLNVAISSGLELTEQDSRSGWIVLKMRKL